MKVIFLSFALNQIYLILVINPFDNNLIDLKIEKFSLRIIDYKLQKKYLSSRTPFLLHFYRNTHWLLVLIFGVYSLISGLLHESQNYYSNLTIFLFFIIYGFFLCTRTYKIYYYHTVYFSSLFLLGALLYYQWTNLEVSEIYTTCLSALVFTINFNLNLLYMLALNLIYHSLMYIRFTFYKLHISFWKKNIFFLELEFFMKKFNH